LLQNSGPGLDDASWRPSDYPEATSDPAIPLHSPGNLFSRNFTALQTAFWYFQQEMIKLYKELTSKTYDSMFVQFLQQWGKLKS
jgi:hypothetical protein